MYTYELPTTGAVSFSDFCIDQSLDKVYGRLIPEATQARANLRAVLKDGKRTDTAQRDFLNLVKVCPTFWSSHPLIVQIIEEYIPYLLSLLNCANHDEIGLKSEPCAYHSVKHRHTKPTSRTQRSAGAQRSLPTSSTIRLGSTCQDSMRILSSPY